MTWHVYAWAQITFQELCAGLVEDSSTRKLTTSVIARAELQKREAELQQFSKKFTKGEGPINLERFKQAVVARDVPAEISNMLHRLMLIQALDKNGDGKLTPEELRDQLSLLLGWNFKDPERKAQLRRFVKAFDADGNGSIDVKEFERTVLDMKKSPQTSKLLHKIIGRMRRMMEKEWLKTAEDMFEHADSGGQKNSDDGDGSITVDELYRWMKTEMGFPVSKRQVITMMRDFDENHDEKVRFHRGNRIIGTAVMIDCVIRLTRRSSSTRSKMRYRTPPRPVKSTRSSASTSSTCTMTSGPSM